MTYTSSTSFRRALEDRLRNQSLRTGVPLARLRKLVVFDRLLMRLVHDRPDAWVLKGGLALQLRLGNRARTTKDMDVLLAVAPDRADDIHQALVRAALLDVGDWFQFEAERPASLPVEPLRGQRFQVRSLLDGRQFEGFHVDVGWGDPLIEPAEILTTPRFWLLPASRPRPFLVIHSHSRLLKKYTPTPAPEPPARAVE